MMEGITKETLKTSSSDGNAPKAVATTVTKTSTSGKKVKPEKREKRPYHYRTKKPRDMPKRPLSAYNYFFRTERGKFVAEQAEKEAAESCPTAPEAVQAEEQGVEKVKSSLFSTMGKTIAKRWKEIVPEELEKYKALAAEDSIRYRAEMDEYHAGRARKTPQKKETKDSPVSKEAGLSASQPAAPTFLEGMLSNLSASVPSRGGTSAAQLQQQQTSFGRDPYLDQLLRLQQAQQGSTPQQQLYGSPTMGSISAGGGGGGVDMSALQSQILDAQLSRAMQQQQQQQQQQQRATLGLDIYSAGAGGRYATAMTSQGPYAGGAHNHNHQAMMDGALFQRVSQGMQAPGQTGALDGALFQRASSQGMGQTAASQLQGGITQGGGEYDSHFQGGGGGSEQQQQLLLQQLMQQQFAASQPQQQQQYSALSARDPQASSGDMARLMLQQQQMASQQAGPGGYALNDAEDRDASGGDSAGERW
jgi:hypothetical protein